MNRIICTLPIAGACLLFIVGVTQAEEIPASPDDVQERAVPRMGEIRDLSGIQKGGGRPPATGSPVTQGQVFRLAAPPAIGPPTPVSPVKELPIDLMITNLRDATGKNIGVRGQVDSAIAAVNANAAQQTNVRALIRVDSFTVYGAGMSATTYTDRPNQRYVNIPYIVGYTVYHVQKNVAGEWFDTSVTRKLSQSITIQMFCDRWETGKGSLKLVTKIDRPYMESNQGILEQVVDFFVNGHLTDFIDSQVRQQINAIPIKNGSTNLPFDCNTLGANKIDLATTKDDVIVYSDHQPRTSVMTGTTALNQVTVKLMSLKRLAAHDLRGGVLYQPTEAPALEFYANAQHLFLPLSPIQEGQQIALNAQPLTMRVPGSNDPLVLVANIIQNVAVGTVPTDSAFTVFDRSMNYGNGIRTIRIQKPYIVQADPRTGAKPYQVAVDAYELTLQITAPGNLLAPPSPGTSPNPGTVTPGLLNLGIQGTIMKRGIDGEPSEKDPIDSQTGPGATDGETPVPAAP